MTISDDQMLQTLSRIELAVGETTGELKRLVARVDRQNGRIGKNENQLELLGNAKIRTDAIAADLLRRSHHDEELEAATMSHRTFGLTRFQVILTTLGTLFGALAATGGVLEIIHMTTG